MAGPVRQSITSTEFRRCNITEIVQGVQQDPTEDSVAWAFLPYGDYPTSATVFYAGSWDPGGPPYSARCLVGPAGIVALAAGTYSMYVKITDNPEVPVIAIPSPLVIY